MTRANRNLFTVTVWYRYRHQHVRTWSHVRLRAVSLHFTTTRKSVDTFVYSTYWSTSLPMFIMTKLRVVRSPTYSSHTYVQNAARDHIDSSRVASVLSALSSYWFVRFHFAASPSKATSVKLYNQSPHEMHSTGCVYSLTASVQVYKYVCTQFTHLDRFDAWVKLRSACLANWASASWNIDTLYYYYYYYYYYESWISRIYTANTWSRVG